MNPIQSILTSVINVLNENKIEHLLIGGHAVNYYGYSRFTSDIDFMLVLRDTNDFVRIMNQAGFTVYDVQPQVVFLKTPDVPVRVDFLRVDPETFAKLMDSAVAATVMQNTVKVPSLNNLLAMKFHSLAQSNLRRVKDLDDIVGLSLKNNVDVETILRPFAIKYATEQIYQLVCTAMQSGQDKQPS